MNQTKRVDSSIELLKMMLKDDPSESESERKRTIKRAISKLKRLKKQPKATYAEIYRVVNEVAESVLKIR